VTHTGWDGPAWSPLDLGAVPSVESIRVWRRKGCCG
jgi:hypothetical protein